MLPILYSFRRCPYAIRARMAIQYSGIQVELREIVLKEKPAELLLASPKGTVPVLVLSNGHIIEQSIEIMQWALIQNDPHGWLCPQDTGLAAQINALINHNDQQFKQHLDQYKYADRYPDHSKEYYRNQGEQFLHDLETQLAQTTFLLTNKISLADIAIFPFIRQFASVDPEWFDAAPYPKLKQWLSFFCNSSDYQSVVQRFAIWQAGMLPFIFP
ncbi:glutathione S-transferase [Iodobacter ciconiae]|uniref:Glutathione S-transferase n=1 Tax=Iodobacter ciconiae TaxID=2496266 RepID=A0A3S8ZQG1_9NEIS|nr:glutathione S-transferase [Iodobacter ciconiae]AZN35713.1 glutathione S-transferase [Iodobacter ciconiae]